MTPKRLLMRHGKQIKVSFVGHCLSGLVRISSYLISSLDLLKKRCHIEVACGYRKTFFQRVNDTLGAMG